ncbi:MAG: ATP-binding protein [Mycobacterium leprae]
MWRPAIIQRAESVLLDEKAAKLMGLARMLDQMLGDGYDQWLPMGATGRLQGLCSALTPVAEQVSSAFGGAGVGYYDVVLDQIVAYAPSHTLGYLVGVTPPGDHLGRIAMRERVERIAVGSMVRGDALNCMHPLVRHGDVIGFTFANESLEEIYRQLQAGNSRNCQSTGFDTVLGLSGLAFLASESTLTAAAIRSRLDEACRNGLMAEDSVRSLTHSLEQVERYTRLFLDNLQAGVMLVDETGSVVLWGGLMSQLTGLPEQGVVGVKWTDLLTQLGAESVQVDRLRPSHDLQLRVRVPLTLRCANRSTDVEVLVAPLVHHSSTPTYYLFLFEETEGIRRQDQYFERAERLALAGELAVAIAHEIRNPLTVVAGSVQLIPQRLTDHEFLVSLSHIAGQELLRVNRTIQGLLGFARYSEPQMALVDLNERVLLAVEFIRGYAQKNGVDIGLDLHPGRLRVHGDAEHLQQALLNLMINGVQAMPDGGLLAVRTEHPANSRFVRVVVSDQGGGIDPEHLPNIWEVFYSSKPGGTGLGLPVVQRIVDEHRGYVEVESAQGKGACFTVLLPVASSSPVPSEE